MKNKRITVDLSEEDLHDLLNGETFEWNYDGVDVFICNSDDLCPECSEYAPNGGCSCKKSDI